jgi:hypothetical protein
MKIIKTSIKLLLITLSINCYSQEGINAKIIKKNGQELNGYIEDYNSMDEYIILNDSEKNSIKINVQEINNLIGEEGNSYFSYNVKINQNYIESIILEKTESRYFHKNVLLKNVLKSKYSLYSLSGFEKNIYYYQVESGELILIDYFEFYSENGKVKNNYKRELFNKLKCSTLTLSDFDKIHYREDDLITFFTKLNNCNNVEVEKISKNKSNLKYNFGIVAGVNNYNLEAFKPYFLSQNSIGLYLGVENSLKFSNNFEVFHKLGYENFSSTSSISETPFASYTIINYSYNVSLSLVSNNIGFRYYFSKNENSFFIDSSMRHTLDIKNPTDANYYIKSTAESVISNPELSFFSLEFGIGYKYKNKYFTELRYYNFKALDEFYQFSSIGFNIKYMFL